MNNNRYNPLTAYSGTNLKKIAKQLFYLGKRKTKILLCEGVNDEKLYSKLVTNSDVYKLQNNDLVDEDRILIGDGGVCLIKKAIILLLKRSFDYEIEKNIPNTFYGIVDLDYDIHNEEIVNVITKVPEYGGSFLFSDRLITTTNTNDVETLLLKYSRQAFNSLYDLSFPSLSKQEWIDFIDFALQKACKIGFLRNDTKIKVLKKDRNRNNPAYVDRKDRFDFNKLFKIKGHTNFDYYQKFVEDLSNNDIDHLINDYCNRCKMNRAGKWNFAFPNNYKGNEWKYCQGHDFIRIIINKWFSLNYIGTKNCLKSIEDSYIQNNILNNRKLEELEKGIEYKIKSKLEDLLVDTIIQKTTKEDFKGSEVYNFIQRNQL